MISWDYQRYYEEMYGEGREVVMSYGLLVKRGFLL
jgi:hypothetical protein